MAGFGCTVAVYRQPFWEASVNNASRSCAEGEGLKEKVIIVGGTFQLSFNNPSDLVFFQKFELFGSVYRSVKLSDLLGSGGYHRTVLAPQGFMLSPS